MRIMIVMALALMFSLVAQAATNDNLQVLSGTLQKAKGKAIRPYYLEIFTAGGGTQRVLLSGKVLDQANSGSEIRVRGYIKTTFMESVPPQPTPAGWIIWMEVEEIIPDQLPAKEIK